MATIINMRPAKSELSDLVSRAEAGEEIIIARLDKPVARLVPIEPADNAPRVPGALAYLRTDLPDDLFLTPMSEKELREWEDGHPGDPLTR